MSGQVDERVVLFESALFKLVTAPDLEPALLQLVRSPGRWQSAEQLAATFPKCAATVAPLGLTAQLWFLCVDHPSGDPAACLVLAYWPEEIKTVVAFYNRERLLRRAAAS